MLSSSARDSFEKPQEEKDFGGENQEFSLELPKEENIDLKKFSSASEITNTFAKSILEPGNLLAIVNHYFPNLDKQVGLDINWFTGNFSQNYKNEEGKVSRGVYANSSKDNATVLERFSRFFHNRHKVNNWRIRKIYDTVPVDEIIKVLYKIYGSHRI